MSKADSNDTAARAVMDAISEQRADGRIRDFASLLPEPPRIERGLWMTLILFYFVGDIATTITLLELGGYESNPLVASIINGWGYLVYIGFKAVFVGLIAVLWYLPTFPAQHLGVPAWPYRSAILSMFALRGPLLVAWNSYVIYSLLSGAEMVIENPFF